MPLESAQIKEGFHDELKAAVQTHQAHGVIFDQALSPVQQRVGSSLQER